MTLVTLSYYRSVPPSALDELREALAPLESEFSEEPREAPTVVMAVDWLFVTGVALFFRKSYFDGFLKEAGKQHFEALRKIAAAAYRSFFGSKPLYWSGYADSEGNLRKSRFSSTFSLIADTSTPYQVKLL